MTSRDCHGVLTTGGFGRAVGKVGQCVALGLAAQAADRTHFVAVGQRKTREIPFKPVWVHPCGRGAVSLAGHPPPDHPGFPSCPAAYFFLAARPRPAGAARNEMPVRIAFC